MKRSMFVRNATLCIALAAFSACNSPQLPSQVPNAAYGVARTASSSGSLIYASGYSDTSGSQVFMLSYPQGQVVGSIAQSTQGMCSDTNGNVYLLYRNAAIEYAHGGTTPIKTLRIPGATTYSCAVDPSSGDVAVTFYCPPCDYQDLAIFPNGSGPPVRYSAPAAYSCTYDGQGDLFLAGGGSAGAIVELPKGSQGFTTIGLTKRIPSVGQIQWDGTDIALQTLYSPGGIYRIKVSGSVGTVLGETKFGRYMRRSGYAWISVADGSVVVPFSVHGDETNNLGLWNYPKGGRAISIIKKIGAGDRGFGSVTISVAPTSRKS